MKKNNNGECISPIDGRYSNRINLAERFTEKSVLLQKILIELEYTYFISDVFNICPSQVLCHKNKIASYIFNDDYYNKVNDYEENVTKHDIKAIELYLKDVLHLHNVPQENIDLVHFCITSQDTVSLANNHLIKTFLLDIINEVDRMVLSLNALCCKEDVFIGRTHGQPATPISFKDVSLNYSDRITEIKNILFPILDQWRCKFGGAIGNGMALKNFNLSETIFKKFVDGRYNMDLTTNTTQTDNWQSLTSATALMSKLSSILIDLCRDFWMYHSYGYFTSNTENYFGSSTMPHKVNPIKFENAEGCLEKCEVDFNFLTNKLSKSRLQRDLSDSIVIRTIGETFSYFELAVSSINSGLKNIKINKPVLSNELENNYQILSEYIQLRLKFNGYEDGYEKSLKMFQGRNHMTKEDYVAEILKLDIPKGLQKEFTSMTPQRYHKAK